MTIEEAYLQFLSKVNRNNKSSNVIASKDRFVALYNEEQIRRVEFILENKNNDTIRQAQKFLVTQPNISNFTVIDQKFGFRLPEDFLDLSSTYCYVNTENCSRIKISLFEIKDFDTQQLVTDHNNKPSLLYREAPFYIGDESIQIFTDGFIVDTVNLTYYRYPKKVDMAGYTKLDGSSSVNIDPEGDDSFINVVLSMCAESFARNYGDINQVQVQKDRVINNN